MKNKQAVYTISIVMVLICALFFFRCKHEEHGSHSEDHAVSEHKDSEHAKEETGHKDDDGDHDGHDHNESSGTGKAVLKADEKKGIQLSEKALETIGIKVKILSRFRAGAANRYNVPSASLVYYEDKSGIYIRRGPWFNLIDVKIIKKGRKITTIRTSGAAMGDLIVVHGSALMRLAQLEAFGASGHGHVH